MASRAFEFENSDENSSDSDLSNYGPNKTVQNTRINNVAQNLFNRQIFGRLTQHPKAKTERIFNEIHVKCRISFNSLIGNSNLFHHIFMGFTICGQYCITYTEKERVNDNPNAFYLCTVEYEVYLWRFTPGKKLAFLSKHRMFKHLVGSAVLDKIMIIQFPMDSHKIVCYGFATTNPDLMYITIITLPAPPKRCKHCVGKLAINEESVNQGLCTKHGFIIHYMFSMSQPTPPFDPHTSLAFSNYLVINTGHCIHILNVNTSDSSTNQVVLNNLKDVDELKLPSNSSVCNDSMSEVSESPSDALFDSNTSVVDAILEDFSEYDLESSDCNKPFHELNISCEPLNVTGRSYHNTLVHNLKQRLHTKEYLFTVPTGVAAPSVQSKVMIDKKSAEKAYEFIEENEKCEKLSSFRKKRLAEKKYEFSEDNSENIVPFNSLRRERRFFTARTQTRYNSIRSPDLSGLFLSPRSPMQSPNARNNGQFSPGRNLSALRNSPHHSKSSPISPRDQARRFYVYSPSIESDCSDSDSRLILRMNSAERCNSNGLLVMAPKTESQKWIKKVVRRYTNGDFENGSLVSGQSRDDYNIPLEIPILVQNLTDQQLDVVPDYKADYLTETHLIVSQRSFDLEQFVQRRAQQLCLEGQMRFFYCEDYDIKIIHVCSVSGQIFGKAVIKIVAVRRVGSHCEPARYISHCLFTWSIVTDAFDVIDSKEYKLVPLKDFEEIQNFEIPNLNSHKVYVLDANLSASKHILRDYNNYFEVFSYTSSDSD